MKFKDENFPTVREIMDAVKEFVDAECGGRWPQDSWFDLGTRWSVNVWEEEGCRHITVYPDGVDQGGYRTTDAFVGIGIQ
jgi:hypothetical protein